MINIKAYVYGADIMDSKCSLFDECTTSQAAADPQTKPTNFGH